MSSNDIPPPVGRNRPPVEHRFGPDHTGNPRGRPKGTRNTKTIVQQIAREKHRVKEGGRPRQITTVELLVRRLLAKAMAGDIKAEKYLERVRDRVAPANDETGYILAPEDMSAEDWIERQERLNQLRTAPQER